MPRKNSPNLIKFAVIGAAGIAVLGLGVASVSLVSSLFDSDGNLQKISRRVAQGPKSKEDADHLKSELENSVKRFLEKNAALSSVEIRDKLQKIFPTSAYEIHVFDLPSALKLVEVDTVLQSCNYLISGKEVAVLRKFDVFDDAKIVTRPSGDTLVLLGHQNAQAGRKPQVKVIELTSAGIKERTDKAVPFFTGEGAAKFAANGQDIDMELALSSRAGEEELFTPSSLRALGLPDEQLKLKLIYKDGNYELLDDNGRGQMAALRAVAFTVADRAQKGRFRKYLTNAVAESIAGIGALKVCPPLFEVKRKGKTVRVAAASPSVSPVPTESDHSSRRSSRRRRREAARLARQAASSQGNFSQGSSSQGSSYFMGNAEDAFELVLARGSGGVYQTAQLRRVKVQGHGADDSVSVASTYENKTSSLVDKLLSSPDSNADSNSGSNSVSNSSSNSGSEKNSSATADVAPLAVPNNKVIEKTAASKVVEKEAVAEKGTVSSTLTSDTVKVRRGAGTNYRTVAEISRGADVEIIGKQEGWYKVRIKGKEGFIYAGFINCKTGDAYTTATVKSGKSVTDARNRTVNLQAGDRLVVLGGINNNKYKVQLANGRTGFVDKDALDVGGESPPAFVP
ncbi:MAG: SH3 domain-containing protein [Candidatus Obscuribacterales bacterium]